jgi:hypothetical protein
VTVTVMFEVPVALGVPVITPVLVLIDSPAGSPLADQVNGATPPAAVIAVPG